ncbi:GNAT family N-acetyltransferase [Allokutzneria sp. A3M-2-11 16]|uniref:GNAT family N-acetyltransferase n=1 Tax=Allokutzneria sp. A3M-2-11 16 TaxID=2962043 RepID=UPI0020B881B3|nr:GNAT family protein [Allokutzneria sp. A3M-2-11 16]MCP3801118.1 GNAT family N-acetyltransferase [Allokutzneria sp. A3M-2-11 16]
MRARSLAGAVVRRIRPEHPGWPAVLGPELDQGRRLRLRPPLPEDAADWSRIVRADQAELEPWWQTSDRSWAERTTEACWREQGWSLRRNARRGTVLPLVIEVDGRFGGEMILHRVDHSHGTAELGAWVASEHRGSGVAAQALRMMVRHAFGPVGLRRIVAPVGVGNRPAAFVLARNGFRKEGLLRRHMDVGGELRDHQLWSLLPEDVDWL